MLAKSRGLLSHKDISPKQSCIRRSKEMLNCHYQVVVNPFIWSRLARQGNTVPFFFGEFKTGDMTIEASSMNKDTTYKMQPLSIGHILETLDGIAQRLLGHTVNHLLKMYPFLCIIV